MRYWHQQREEMRKRGWSASSVLEDRLAEKRVHERRPIDWDIVRLQMEQQRLHNEAFEAEQRREKWRSLRTVLCAVWAWIVR